VVLRLALALGGTPADALRILSCWSVGADRTAGAGAASTEAET
jgi:hypothetical protein